MDSPEDPTKSTYEDQPATDLSDVTYASKDIRTTPKASKSSRASEWLGGFAGLSLAFVVESVVNIDHSQAYEKHPANQTIIVQGPE